MIITKYSNKLRILRYQVTIYGDFRMNKTIDQTKPQHTETTMVRWTKSQAKALRQVAFQNEKQPAVFIREFMLKHCPELAQAETDERL